VQVLVGLDNGEVHLLDAISLNCISKFNVAGVLNSARVTDIAWPAAWGNQFIVSFCNGLVLWLDSTKDDAPAKANPPLPGPYFRSLTAPPNTKHMPVARAEQHEGGGRKEEGGGREHGRCGRALWCAVLLLVDTRTQAHREGGRGMGGGGATRLSWLQQMSADLSLILSPLRPCTHVSMFRGPCTCERCGEWSRRRRGGWDVGGGGIVGWEQQRK
jgi:hypothetical protein